jgi:hypothetical protein
MIQGTPDDSQTLEPKSGWRILGFLLLILLLNIESYTIFSWLFLRLLRVTLIYDLYGWSIRVCVPTFSNNDNFLSRYSRIYK